jgi:hypothetical protein
LERKEESEKEKWRGKCRRVRKTSEEKRRKIGGEEKVKRLRRVTKSRVETEMRF